MLQGAFELFLDGVQHCVCEHQQLNPFTALNLLWGDGLSLA